MWFLLWDESPIAFEYSHNAKGICHSYKIGFDEAFKELGPVRLLRKPQLEYLNEWTQDTRVLDTQGILCQTKAKWSTRTYNTGTLLASGGGLLSNVYVRGYSTARNLKQKLKADADEIAIGAAKFTRTS